jgi:hypothetical protein
MNIVEQITIEFEQTTISISVAVDPPGGNGSKRSITTQLLLLVLSAHCLDVCIFTVPCARTPEGTLIGHGDSKRTGDIRGQTTRAR